MLLNKEKDKDKESGGKRVSIFFPLEVSVENKERKVRKEGREDVI